MHVDYFLPPSTVAVPAGSYQVTAPSYSLASYPQKSFGSSWLIDTFPTTNVCPAWLQDVLKIKDPPEPNFEPTPAEAAVEAGEMFFTKPQQLLQVRVLTYVDSSHNMKNSAC